MTENDLSTFLVGVREQIAADIDDERSSVIPDFASMIAAAHEHDPERTPIERVHEADALAPVFDLRARDSEAAMIAEDQLDALIGEARVTAERDVAERRLAAIPVFSLAGVEPRTRPWIPVLVAAAAIAGLTLALPRLFDRFVDGARNEAANNNQAEFQARERDDAEAEQPPRMERVRPDSETGEAIAMDHASHAARRHEPAKLEETKPKPKADERSLADRIAALDDEAQRLWAAGELEAAGEAFRAIIKLAGRTRHADLAYGDLFTLTHQRKDESTELALWHEYLRRFPSGRFADDARAGLCRRGPADDRASCWRAYLADFPTGVHRRSAERALGTSDSP